MGKIQNPLVELEKHRFWKLSCAATIQRLCLRNNMESSKSPQPFHRQFVVAAFCQTTCRLSGSEEPEQLVHGQLLNFQAVDLIGKMGQVGAVVEPGHELDLRARNVKKPVSDAVTVGPDQLLLVLDQSCHLQIG